MMTFFFIYDQISTFLAFSFNFSQNIFVIDLDVFVHVVVCGCA
jgi:hypothetical protein